MSLNFLSLSDLQNIHVKWPLGWASVVAMQEHYFICQNETWIMQVLTCGRTLEYILHKKYVILPMWSSNLLLSKELLKCGIYDSNKMYLKVSTMWDSED